MLIEPDELAAYEADGYLKSQRHPTAPYTIWNYTQQTQYESNWDRVTRNARGLIIADDGTIIARPFPKIFNYGEPACVLPAGERHWVTEKLDGSLGIVYVLPDGTFDMATRGSFVSEQAKVGRQLLEDHLEREGFMWPVGVTPLFEIIYPENRIVVDYGSDRKLVLLAGIDMETGLDRTHDIFWDGERAAKHQPSHLPALQEAHSGDEGNREGVVVAFEGGTRVKIKTEQYTRLHKIVTGLNSKGIWEMLRDGKAVDEIIEGTPDEFFAWVIDCVGEIVENYGNIEMNAELELQDAPRRDDYEDRRAYNKAFAEWAAKEDPPVRAVLFAMRDDKEYEQIIWKAVKPRRAEQHREVVE